VKTGNSSRCCKFPGGNQDKVFQVIQPVVRENPAKGFGYLMPLVYPDREGAETGTSQKTCRCKTDDFAAHGE